MRPGVLAVGWEFRRRHAWPLMAMGAYMLVLAAIRLLGLGPSEAISMAPPDGRAAVLIAPLSWLFMYYLAVFSYGFSGDLAARQSIFPARMFTLPVRTEVLVLGPMAHGAVAVAMLVQAATLLARWPWGLETPFVWPALMAAVFLAWTQALTWMPYGLPGLRVIVTVLWLMSLDTVVLLAMHFKVREPVMLALLVPQLPLAYLTACYAVARARRGDVPDWRPRAMRSPAVAETAPIGRAGFASPARAQLWFEWRRHGLTLPAWVAMLLPFELALLWIARGAWGLALEILLLALVTPALVAGFTATAVSKANPHARDADAMSPFIAARPLPSADLIAAKLTMALFSTLATWVLVMVAVPVALKWSGTWPMVMERMGRLAGAVGTPRAIVAVVLLVLGLMASTWKQCVQGLFIGLSGRAWITRAMLVAVLAFVIVIGPAVQYVVDHDRARAVLWNAVPAIVAALAACKLIAAAVVAALLARSGLLRDRTLVRGAALWTAAVLALYGVLSWLVSGPLVPEYFLVLLAIVAVPLARVSAAPLALAWNRHR